MMLRSLQKSRKGATYIEFLLTAFILGGLFVSVGVIGAMTIDFDRDNRATAVAIDLVSVLDDETALPDQAQIDTIGERITEVTSIGANEDFQVILSLIAFEHRPPAVAAPPVGTVLRWEGAYGTVDTNTSRVSISGGQAIVNGIAFDIRDDEKMIVAEIFRARRGLFFSNTTFEYSFGVGYKSDPDFE